jgi:hypothetical protein
MSAIRMEIKEFSVLGILERLMFHKIKDYDKD